MGLIEVVRERFEAVKASAAQNVARAVMELRDLLNTPLQTIEFSLALIAEEKAGSTPLLSRIQKALHQMQLINESMVRYEKDVDWHRLDLKN